MEAAAVALKAAIVAPAVTVTEGNKVSRSLLLTRVTLVPPAGAVWFRVTVQVPTAFWPRLTGTQAKPETRGVNRPMAAVCELLPRVAVTVALWLVGIAAAAVALKVAVVAPAATVTEGCRVSRVLLLTSVTLVPPAGATWAMVTVQVLTA